MAHAIGSLDKDGSPTLKIKVAGVNKPTEFVAIIDTGFTGFLSMPLIAAFPLGLPLKGTTSVELADGNEQSKLMAHCKVTIDDKTDPQFGLVILEPSSTAVLAGMEFLRAFKFGLFLSASGIILFDDEEFAKAAREAEAESKRHAGKQKSVTAPLSSSERPPPSDQSPLSGSS
jgi:predicted aspartyl protease